MTREAIKTRVGPGYVSYLVRLWRDDDAAPDYGQRPAPWRWSLQNPHTGQRLGFPSLEALFDYLREQANKASDLNEKEQS